MNTKLPSENTNNLGWACLIAALLLAIPLALLTIEAEHEQPAPSQAEVAAEVNW